MVAKTGVETMRQLVFLLIRCAGDNVGGNNKANVAN